MMNNSTSKQAGFSLLEILVAMAILSIIVMTLSTIFNQSSQAWDRGLSKSEKAMAGRAALNMMTTDLKNAIAGDGSLLKDVSFSGSSMSFNTMGKVENGKRLISFVTYSGNTKVNRSVGTYDDNYTFNPAPAGEELLTADAFIVTPNEWSGAGTNLPESVTLTLKLKSRSSSGRVEAWSYGPDGRSGGNDDINSEVRK